MPDEKPKKPINVEALAALFNRQASITRSLYEQRVMLRRAPLELFSDFEAEQLRQEFYTARAALRNIARHLEEQTGKPMPPLEVYYCF